MVNLQGNFRIRQIVQKLESLGQDAKAREKSAAKNGKIIWQV